MEYSGGEVRDRRRLIFFFSSRRRHTRLQGDWSSDVCSSDLPDDSAFQGHQDSVCSLSIAASMSPSSKCPETSMQRSSAASISSRSPAGGGVSRSEERRVGKEGRSRWSPYH